MTSSANSESVTYAKASGVKTAAETGDRIDHVKLSLAFLPLATPVSDAKVLTGRQKPLTEVAIIIAEIHSRDGLKASALATQTCGRPGHLRSRQRDSR
jgi:hypothetical protein